ncbi:MAG: sulfurtransferase FdhD, partial [Haliea sp.]
MAVGPTAAAANEASTDAAGEVLPAALVPHAVHRIVHGEPDPAITRDTIAAEVPVALVFNGISHAVMMATPRDLHAFAVGFALSEGVLDSLADLRDIETRVTPADCDLPAGVQACEVHMDISARCFARLKDKRRSLAGRTGCGVCGIDSLQMLDLLPERVMQQPWLAGFGHAAIQRAMAAMPALQLLNAEAGSLHAAAW